MRRLALTALFVVASLSTAAAQHQPYAGMQSRPIKALSEQQIGDLKAGRGMGLALPAELNGYPGPLHVLELGDKLELTADQRARVQGLFDSMKAEAVPLGEKLIAQEAELEQQFAQKLSTPASLSSATAAIGETQGALRHAHLKYHLATLGILSAEQTQRYAALRGYQEQQQHQQHHK
jgi:LTXXQ motif family protein